MARYYRRRYTRVVKPKKKWASNIVTFNNQPVNAPFALTLVTNSQQSANPTPTIVKTGNFKISLDVYISTQGDQISSSLVVQAFVLYVPEGWTTANIPGIVGSHPEWILASKTVGGSYLTQATVFSLETLNMSSRLKRNLNSADGIVLLLVPSEQHAGAVMKVSGHVRFWTCAN